MSEQINVKSTELLEITSNIVTSYLSKANVSISQIPEIIHIVHGVLHRLKLNEGLPIKQAEILKAAVPVRRSVMPDYIVCLEDGKKLRMLKRHLRTTYGLSPEEYRARWNLPSDYPMVAPNYAKQRSEFAKKIGLGHGTPRRGAAKQNKWGLS